MQQQRLCLELCQYWSHRCESLCWGFPDIGWQPTKHNPIYFSSTAKYKHSYSKHTSQQLKSGKCHHCKTGDAFTAETKVAAFHCLIFHSFISLISTMQLKQLVQVHEIGFIRHFCLKQVQQKTSIINVPDTLSPEGTLYEIQSQVVIGDSSKLLRVSLSTCNHFT